MPKPYDELKRFGSLLGLGEAEEPATTPDVPDAPDDSGIVLVCVDLEAYELDQRCITEVGIATLDSRHLPAPSKRGKAVTISSWIKQIRSDHYIVKEYRHMINKRYVKGCPDGFVFGTSKTIPEAQARIMLRRHLSEPRSLYPGAAAAVAASSSLLSSSSSSAAAAAASSSSSSVVSNPPPPKVYIVGHGLRNDKKLMKTFGIPDVHDTGVVGDIDTQRLCSTKQRQASLMKMLDAMDVPYRHLHNGGNDCTYTLQALLKMIWMQRYGSADLGRRLDGLRSRLENPEPSEGKKRRWGRPKGDGERSVAEAASPKMKKTKTSTSTLTEDGAGIEDGSGTGET